jgi:hypothetical protein
MNATGLATDSVLDLVIVRLIIDRRSMVTLNLIHLIKLIVFQSTLAVPVSGNIQRGFEFYRPSCNEIIECPLPLLRSP